MLRLVAQSCPTLCDAVDCSPPGSSVHGDSPGKNTGVGCHALLQGIFPTQGLNPGLPHCRWILYQLSYQGSLFSIVAVSIYIPTNSARGSPFLHTFFNMWLIHYIVQQKLVQYFKATVSPQNTLCFSTRIEKHNLTSTLQHHI